MDSLIEHEQIGETLCSRCQRLDLRRYLVGHEDPGPIELGDYQEIFKARNCPFCKLIICALSAESERYWQENVYPVEKCYLGRIWKTSGASGLATWFDSTTSTFPPGVSGYKTTKGEVLVLEPSSCQRQDIRAGLARVVGEPRVDFSLIRDWISSCEQDHGPACGQLSHKATTCSTYIRLLDVKRMSLVSGDQSCRYFALSYVWGNAATFQTLKSNLSELEEDGSILRLRRQFPQCIDDTISLISALGERFLWVDALCIVQDDARDKQSHMPRMDVIFSQATATIVSLSGQDASAGLPGVREASRRVRQCSVTIDSWRLFAKLPELTFVAKRSEWYTRAWTFQEQIMSRRCIFFSKDQVYFRCQSAYYTEDTYGDQTSPLWNCAFSSPCLWGPTFASQKDPSILFGVYKGLVQSYSCKRHTYDSDSLNAFQGILSSFSTFAGWRFTSGLPEDAFDLALLWKPDTIAYLRPRGSCHRPEDRNCSTPTWCWTSWNVSVDWDHYRTDSYARKAVSLTPAVDYFVLASCDGFRSICRKNGNNDSDNIRENLEDAKNHCKNHGIRWGEWSEEPTIPWGTVLLFKASATNLSRLTLLCEYERREKHQKMSEYVRRRCRGDVWLYDNDGRHCGSLYELPYGSMRFRNQPRYELILLSSFSQGEVTQADVNAHEAGSFRLEYPSRDDYYSQIFDISHFQYKTQWAQNIMLIEWNGNLATRVAIGNIHIDAWAALGSSVKMIALV